MLYLKGSRYASHFSLNLDKVTIMQRKHNFTINTAGDKKSITVVHTIKRLINLEPLVTLEMQLKELKGHDGLDYTVSFVFLNLTEGKWVEYRGPRKTALVSLLEGCVGSSGLILKSMDDVSIRFNRQGLRLQSPEHGKVTVFTGPVFGQDSDSVMTKLDDLLTILHEFMQIKKQWVRHGTYSQGERYKQGNIDNGEVYFKEIAHKGQDIEGSMYLLAHPVRYRSGEVRNRIYMNHLGKKDLVLIDSVGRGEGNLPKTQRPIPIAFERFICAVDHVQRLDQRNHMIHLDAELLRNMGGYVSLTQLHDHRRIVMNFDQHPASSKIYWFHTPQFTGDVLTAMREIYDHYL